jgi:predicted O-methyltransferase YrrM
MNLAVARKMLNLKQLLDPASYPSLAEKVQLKTLTLLNPSYKAARAPGHYTSPLLDLRKMDQIDQFDGEQLWQSTDLRCEAQQSYYEALLSGTTDLKFPAQRSPGRAYYSDNDWFSAVDAFTLSAIMQKEKPTRIIEVGSGFSSAAMLDTRRLAGLSTHLTFIEPAPERLFTLIKSADEPRVTVIQDIVQNVSLDAFDQLEAGDILFIDSSHVVKVGSDVPWILLVILPRLKKGVIVHFHDIFYPTSYPRDWLADGRCWNESQMLRAFLVNNSRFEVTAFNAFAQQKFPQLFRERMPAFLDTPGQSIWLRVRAD